jgi:hypothetical protein
MQPVHADKSSAEKKQGTDYIYATGSCKIIFMGRTRCTCEGIAGTQSLGDRPPVHDVHTNLDAMQNQTSDMMLGKSKLIGSRERVDEGHPYVDIAD